MINANCTNVQSTPPVVLVQTWCLLSRDRNEEISKHALNMLLNTFGDLRTAVEFVKINNIRVNYCRPQK
ncbi:MAG: hypothetical protein ACI92O_003085 [Colwellia sp.]|jgi:hypothetical protein